MDPALRALDNRLVAAAKGIHVLTHLSWPSRVQEAFLAEWQRGRPTLPEVVYPPLELGHRLAELDAIIAELERHQEPVARFLADTARSYHGIARLLTAAGTPGASTISLEVYGRPGDKLPGSATTNVEAAHYFVDTSRQYNSEHHMAEADYVIDAEVVAERMRERVLRVIPDQPISIVIDPNLASKAAAGATRVRLRAGRHFTEYSLEQLLQHEVFVHSLTALNGRAQPAVSSLSLGAPRTTATQEGLATFAELITGAIDISRMERIALRIMAIEAALGGADFIEVFRFFLEQGQPAIESFNSTMRIFRGVPVTGQHAFTKDGVYLHGLLEVHTFFRWALQNDRLRQLENLFAGRMTLSDVLSLDDAFTAGTINRPRYLPEWMTRTNGLTAYLAFSVFANRISLDAIEAAEFGRIMGAGGNR